MKFTFFQVTAFFSLVACTVADKHIKLRGADLTSDYISVLRSCFSTSFIHSFTYYSLLVVRVVEVTVLLFPNHAALMTTAVIRTANSLLIFVLAEEEGAAVEGMAVAVSR
jgi:hypothetical protein